MAAGGPKSAGLADEIRQLLKYHLGSGRRQAEHDRAVVFQKTMRDLAAVGLGELKGKRVLDLGCGQRFSLALQAAAEGASVTALDVSHVRPDFLPLYFWRIMRRGGFKRAAKSTVRRVFFDPMYYHRLESEAGRPLRRWRKTIDFVVAEPTRAEYPLAADSFDLIVSNAVLEHVADVGRYASEIKRMLVSGGYFYGLIHNFYSLSGGHNLEWAYPDVNPSTRVPPWDHLRGDQFPTFVFLNRLRPQEYLAVFEPHLSILLFEGRDINHQPEVWEGEKFLTPEMEAELSLYPRELLLTRSYCLIGRKN